jgi:transglutaminase-like putative cysteine protease
MSPLIALRVVTYLVVADGIAGLLLARLIDPLGAGLVAVAILVSWWLEGQRAHGRLRPAVAWGLVASAAVALGVDLFYLAASALDGMVHVLLFLIVARLFMCRGRSDLRDAGFLSFFLLVAASSATFSMGFLGVYVVFIVLATWMLILHQMLAESEKAGRTDLVGARVALRGQMMRVSLGAAAGTFAIASLLFFVIPRVGQATLPFRAQLSRVTGFSERVDLGAFGDIESDSSVVMRVYLREEVGDPGTMNNLRWRGIVFDRFDGRVWSVGRFERRPIRRAGDRFALASPRGRGPIVRQEIYLEPIGTDIVFAAPRALRMDLRTGVINMDDMGVVTVPVEAARLHYTVESELELPPPPGTHVAAAGATLSAEDRHRYLQLPPVSSGIPRLAREVAAGSADPYEAATRLTRFLSRSYRYSLSKTETAQAPLDEFLFRTRAGNCEYFSAALAVMLRTLGIPARVVGGFQRGDWNPYGRYFMVRLSDAHAWVEAHFDGLGWVTLDPSPRSDESSDLGVRAFSLYLDAARMRWYRYVVNWGLQDQRLVVSTVQRQAHDFRLSFAWPGAWRAKSWLTASGVALAVAAIAWIGWRLRRAGGSGGPVPRMPRFYERALRHLARRGLAPESAETARQFSARAGVAMPQWAEPFGRITRLYERARFGMTSLTDAELRVVDESLAQIERSARSVARD